MNEKRIVRTKKLISINNELIQQRQNFVSKGFNVDFSLKQIEIHSQENVRLEKKLAEYLAKREAV